MTVNLTGVISSIQYTGEVKMLVKRQKFDRIEIDAGKGMQVFLMFLSSDYLYFFYSCHGFYSYVSTCFVCPVLRQLFCSCFHVFSFAR